MDKNISTDLKENEFNDVRMKRKILGLLTNPLTAASSSLELLILIDDATKENK